MDDPSVPKGGDRGHRDVHLRAAVHPPRVSGEREHALTGIDELLETHVAR